MNTDLFDLLSIEAKEIALSFEKARVEGRGTPQEVSDRRENAFVNIFLSKYFPFPYKVVKGNIIDSYNKRSHSIDCIILNPSHPYTIDPKNERASVIFADGVDYVIEVKPDLNSKIEIERSLEQVSSVKTLRRKRNGLLLAKKKYNSAQINCSYQLPVIIFSRKTYASMKRLLTYIMEYYIREKVPLDKQFDYIVINDRAIVFNSRKNSYCDYSKKGLYYVETKEQTLITMLFLLNRMPRSEPAIGPHVLNFYLGEHTFDDKLKGFDDINTKLNGTFKILE